MANANCLSCGGPDDGEAVLCKYCQRAISAEVQASAVPCPHCRTLCRWGKQKCHACQSWIVVSCVFCGALSPHNQPACLACKEAFAGAAERKQQRVQQQSHAESMQTFGVVGNIAASFLGAAAGSAVVNHAWGHGSSYSYGDSSYGDASYGDSGGGEINTFVDNTNESDTSSDSTDWSGGSDDSSSGSDDLGGGWDE